MILLATLLLGQTPQEPPIAAPLNFSGASGFYRMTTSAVPSTVQVENPLIFIVTITGDGPKKFWPARKKLKIISKALLNDFYLKELASRDRHYPSRKMWKFYYQLRPKHENIKVIPELHFVYWYPKRGKFQTSISDPVELKITPRPKVKIPAKAIQQIHVPKQILQIADAPSALQRARAAPRPNNLAVATAVIIPPLLCGLWVWWWKRAYPDAAKTHRRRQSRAAEIAVRQLQSKGEDADEIVRILAQYLTYRIDVTARELSACEIAHRLSEVGSGNDISSRIVSFWRRCDALRFGSHTDSNRTSLRNEAVRLIQDLEAEPCFDIV